MIQASQIATLAQRTAGLCAAALVLASGLQGWPTELISGFKAIGPPHVILFGWAACAAFSLVHRTSRTWLSTMMPPTCVGVYICLGLLSIAASDSPQRATIALIKTAMSLVGTYVLVRAALQQGSGIQRLTWAWLLVTSLVLVHAATEACIGKTAVALFESPLKLGTFLSMAVPLATAVLVTRRTALACVWASLIVVAALLVCASVWAWVGIVAGVLLACPPTSGRWLAVTLFTGALAIGLTHVRRELPPVVGDFQVREEAGPDVRQRYLEWQALINLLKDRGATGTGIGCMNDYRSQYYLRLPKNNTIAPFDQNGYLASAAELGLPGLIAMCWIVGEYLQRGWRNRRNQIARAACGAVLGGAVAQIGSSLTYNGIIIVFAVLLAVIDGQERGNEATV